LAAIAPGVLGITGIETIEIIKGVVAHVHPTCLVIIDSLAAGDLGRIGTTIQIADTGISPGSGIGVRRAAINQETMGIPVIAIGVPTVVHAAIIIHQALLTLQAKWGSQPFTADMGQKITASTAKEITASVLKPFQVI
jgi:spore protease